VSKYTNQNAEKYENTPSWNVQIGHALLQLLIRSKLTPLFSIWMSYDVLAILNESKLEGRDSANIRSILPKCSVTALEVKKGIDLF
jgi:hypothetical protein